MLKILNHNWSTQKKKSLNKGVTSYAPKDRTFLKTISLDTRVAIAGATQVCGYQELWKERFYGNNLDVDDNFLKHMVIMDMVKNNKNRRATMKEGKARRSRKRNKKIQKTQTLDKEAQKAGKHLMSGIVMNKAKKDSERTYEKCKQKPT